MADMIRAYHFLQEDMTASSGDEKAWEVGETRTIVDRSKVILCEYGYHSSPSLWDAFNYGQGPMACLVEISKPVQTDESTNQRKAVSATRKLIKAVNINRELRLFACDCAERVLHIYERDHSSKAPREAIAVARRFADGKATKEELNTACAAASNAAWNAASNAAWDAARAAWNATARAAARDAARATACAAASNAAWDAALAAARAAWNATARAAARAPAWAAAWDAAESAEIKWQQKHFEEMFGNIFKESR